VLDPSDLALRTELDGQVKQDSRTSLLLHDVATLVSYVSHVMTLLPGDMILTGTPSGVGPMTAGQTVSVTIEGIGTLSNPVRAR
jgi:2-keto-4-pentenoate hydratase/2-oxohepta-3-ene-1,7-dioic acid hydratase in catechol pathway